jgi:coproporphyrinogen III oxidase-like Fe-S oxidoreductase
VGLIVTDVKDFVIWEAMTPKTLTPKNLEELMERVRHWPKERQEDAAEVLFEMERQDASGYRLTGAQAQEVARIQLEVREGRATFATDEQMAALWKSCGL